VAGSGHLRRRRDGRLVSWHLGFCAVTPRWAHTRSRTCPEQYALSYYAVRTAIANLTHADVRSASHANAVDFSANHEPAREGL
jgi:hypothetical protein